MGHSLGDCPAYPGFSAVFYFDVVLGCLTEPYIMFNLFINNFMKYKVPVTSLFHQPSAPHIARSPRRTFYSANVTCRLTRPHRVPKFRMLPLLDCPVCAPFLTFPFLYARFLLSPVSSLYLTVRYDARTALPATNGDLTARPRRPTLLPVSPSILIHRLFRCLKTFI
jgi:hypothetical protein